MSAIRASRPGTGVRVLFVGHEAKRAGAPIMLLHLLRWLRDSTDISFDLLLRRGGEILGDYSELCEVFQVWHLKRMLKEGRDEAVRSHFRSAYFLRWTFERREIGLVYSNTILNARLLGRLGLACPLVVHVHEVESALQTIPPDDFAAIDGCTALFIVVSNAAYASLTRRGVSEDKIVLVPGFAPIASMPAPDRSRRLAFRKRHGIPEDAILIGGCGRLDWQKEPAILVQAALVLAERPGKRLHFAWLGGREGELAFQRLRWDIERAGLVATFTTVQSTPDPLDYFDSLDIFALVSRDDPVPLVAVEAGARGIPVVTFEGNAEFVDVESGVVVPYLDVSRFASALGALACDEGRRTAMGRRLAEKVRERHDVSIGATQIAAIIRRFVGDPGSTWRNERRTPR